MRHETREKLIAIREKLMVIWQTTQDPELYELYQRLWNTLEVDRLQEEKEKHDVPA
jgi:hypothetical protein